MAILVTNGVPLNELAARLVVHLDAVLDDVLAQPSLFAHFARDESCGGDSGATLQEIHSAYWALLDLRTRPSTDN